MDRSLDARLLSDSGLTKLRTLLLLATLSLLQLVGLSIIKTLTGSFWSLASRFYLLCLRPYLSDVTEVELQGGLLSRHLSDSTLHLFRSRLTRVNWTNDRLSELFNLGGTVEFTFCDVVQYLLNFFSHVEHLLRLTGYLRLLGLVWLSLALLVWLLI